MSTATATQHHFPHSIALAAAASVVVVGGLTALGIAAAQDDATTAPSQTHTTTYPQHQMCPDARCLPQQHPQGGGHNSRSVESPHGGRVMIGLP